MFFPRVFIGYHIYNCTHLHETNTHVLYMIIHLVVFLTYIIFFGKLIEVVYKQKFIVPHHRDMFRKSRQNDINSKMIDRNLIHNISSENILYDLLYKSLII